MKIAGFTFVRNAVRYDYPVLESLRSLLPLCDAVYIAVGQSDDETLALVQGLKEPKLHILETVWDDALREGGRVLAIETDKAFDAIPEEYDWCIYLQADEVLHEADYPAIRAAMQEWLSDPATEGLVFKYRHFYGSYDFTGASRRWYRREVRVLRNNKSIRSYRDAQGFRLQTGATLRKLRVRPVAAWVYHYGWVKHPADQQRKQQSFNKLWHSDDWVSEHVGAAPTYHYDGSEPLEAFTGTHPAAMQARISSMNWHFETNPAQVRWSWKDRLSKFTERWFGWRPGEYKNYQEIR